MHTALWLGKLMQYNYICLVIIIYIITIWSIFLYWLCYLLFSPSLIALSSKDPILTAFELSWELRRLSFAEHEFKSEYLVSTCNFKCKYIIIILGRLYMHSHFGYTTLIMIIIFRNCELSAKNLQLLYSTTLVPLQN